jgi:prepilin-type N-terminal cleavage/methylation domain-containing protein
MKRSKEVNGGFTLIELVVVMAIIAILATLIVAAIAAARRQSINTQRSGNVKTIETALESYYTKNKSYPTADTDVVALVSTLKTAGALTSDISGVDATNKVYYAYKSDGTKLTIGACDVDGLTAAGTPASVTNAGDQAIVGCKSGTAYIAVR